MAYTTAANVKTYLKITGSGDDTLIGDLITRAQKAIESYCGRVFEAASDTTRYFDAVEDVAGRRLWLDKDLCAITSVTNGDGDTVSSADYVTQPRNDTPYYALTLVTSSTVSWTYTDDPEDAIAIVGKWAYSTTAPADIVHATIRLASYYYRQKDAQVFGVTSNPEQGQLQIPEGIPRDIRAMLWPYKLRTYAR